MQYNTYTIVHGILVNKVNTSAHLFNTLNNRQCAKWHAIVRAVCYLAHLIKNYLSFLVRGKNKDELCTARKTPEPNQ